jgi:DNA-binding HxlR family transcriptional regulator
MLRQLLALFDTTPGPISLDLLAAQLDVEPAVLEGMLTELVRMGRVSRVEDRTESACAACGFTRGCPYVLSNAGVCYVLANAKT